METRKGEQGGSHSRTLSKNGRACHIKTSESLKNTWEGKGKGDKRIGTGG